jgi:hypothetical protein
LALGLESILRAGPLKIVLQQNRPEAEVKAIRPECLLGGEERTGFASQKGLFFL